MTSKNKAPRIKTGNTPSFSVDTREKERLETQMCKLFVQGKLLNTEKTSSIMDEYIR